LEADVASGTIVVGGVIAMPKRILVTGGAGFIGSNLVDRLLEDGHDVLVFDALLRPGSQTNLEWLRSRHLNGRLTFVNADVRDFEAVTKAVSGVEVIYHLAGQVAVTWSVEDPREDFLTNALGTFNVLEAARLREFSPIVLFTSTNKVYGAMEQVPVLERESRYEYRDMPAGVDETQPLDFHSPYGCSKGAAEQYVHDYARIYDMPTVVFRMSCIYGPRQFGTEDQGWLAHFMFAAARGQAMTIYGNGKQVRDILFVDDLVRALRAAVDRIDVTAGEVFNIGGGPGNTLSIWHEFGDILARLKGDSMQVRFDEWRPGDQPCYVSNTEKAHRLLDWEPRVNKETGLELLWQWVSGLEGPSLSKLPGRRFEELQITT
jgi:CDP-paratose 2-epimerase